MNRSIARRPLWSLAIALLVILLLWLLVADWPPGLTGLIGRKRVVLNAVLNGITLGGLYFLVASGFTLIFGLMRNVNFAHGTFYLLGGYVGYVVATAVGSWLLAFVVAFAVAALLGIALQVSVLRRMGGRTCARLLRRSGLPSCSPT